MRKKILAVLIGNHFKKVREWRAVTRRRFESVLSAKLGLHLYGDNALVSKDELKLIALDLVDMHKPNAYISDQNITDTVEAYLHGELEFKPS